MNTARTGVVVGKFNPPHLGHLHLIDQAAKQVDHLYVLLCDRPDQTLDVELRRTWLADASPPNVTIIVTPDDLPGANEPWAERALQLLPMRPELAFTSEDWGPGWAAAMGAEHVLVDRDRRAQPISATELRADLGANFHWLVPAARADLARRVVVIGAESTGKSTLAEALARELSTVWVPEHGRWYWEGRRHLVDHRWSTEEFRRIAAAQHRLELDLARQAARAVVIADTDALVTSVWHERYLDAADTELDRMASDVVPDLYLVCCPDFDWVQDGTRESEDHRIVMQESMTDRANASGARVVQLEGPHDHRLAAALESVEPLTRLAPLI